jgi:hypothetical protein
VAREFLASKIVSGRGNPSPRATWWCRHGDTLAKFLEGSKNADAEKMEVLQLDALRLAGEWDGRLPSSFPKGTMERHIGLELGLISGVRKKDHVGVENVGNLLTDHVTQQAEELATLAPGMPKDRLRRLIEEHVAILTERIRHDIEGTDKGPCEERFRANSLALADFSTEWF